MRRLAKRDVVKAARSMRRTKPHVESEPHKVSEPLSPGLAKVREALLRDFADEDHTKCGHGMGHCMHSAAFRLLFYLRSPFVATLMPNELDDIEGTLRAVKDLLEQLDSTMQGHAARVVDPHSPLDRALQGIFRGLMLMNLARIRLGERL